MLLKISTVRWHIIKKWPGASDTYNLSTSIDVVESQPVQLKLITFITSSKYPIALTCLPLHHWTFFSQLQPQYARLHIIGNLT